MLILNLEEEIKCWYIRLTPCTEGGWGSEQGQSRHQGRGGRCWRWWWRCCPQTCLFFLSYCGYQPISHEPSVDVQHGGWYGMEYTMGVATTPHVCAPCVCGHCDINFSTVFAGFKTPRKGMAISKMLLMEREFMLEALLPAVLLSEARAFILHLSCSDLRFTAPTNRRFPDAVKIRSFKPPPL